MSKKNDDALTSDEISVLRSDRTPETIRQFTARQHENLAVRTSAYRKVAAAARAERSALLEIRMLQVTRQQFGMADPVSPPERTPIETTGALVQENEALRAMLAQATALDAVVVNGD